MEFNQEEESNQNENEEEDEPELRRSSRIANLLPGETPCNDAIPTVTETFAKKAQKETNANYDLMFEQEYDRSGNKTTYNKEDYNGESFDPSQFTEDDFVEGNLNGRSVQDDTAKNYANLLFRNESKSQVKINELPNNKNKDTFTNHLTNNVYPKYGISNKIMSKSTTGNSWRPDLDKMAKMV
jgi:hypothetical protein